MTKKTALICDVCNDRIAKSSCDICGKDLCDKCSKIKMVGSMVTFIEYVLCSPCENQIQRISVKNPALFKEVFKEKKELLDGIIEGLKAVVMLAKVEGEEEPPFKEEEKEDIFKKFIPNKIHPIDLPDYNRPYPYKPYPYPNPFFPKPKKKKPFYSTKNISKALFQKVK